MANKVIVISGQSNAVGRASEAIDTPTINNHVFTRTKIYWGGAWVNYDPHIVQIHDRIAGDNGVDVYLAYMFETDPKYSGDTLYLIHYAEGGRPLYNTSPSRTLSPDAAGNIYDEFVAHATAAYAAIPTSYSTLGFYWMQGETDSQVLLHSQSYYANLTSLFNTHIATDVPQALTGKIVIGNISLLSAWTYKSYIDDAQLRFITETSNAVLINTTNLPFDPGDDGHMSSSSYHVIAKDIYAVFTDSISVNTVRDANTDVLVIDDNSTITDDLDYDNLIVSKAQPADIVVDTRSLPRLSIKNDKGLAFTLPAMPTGFLTYEEVTGEKKLGIGLGRGISVARDFHLHNYNNTGSFLMRLSGNEADRDGAVSGLEFGYESANYSIILQGHTNKPAIIGCNNLYQLKIDPTTNAIELPYGSLKFASSSSLSTDPNTLDDYGEGVWTPILGGSTSESGQVYGSATNGRYVKIGRLVTCFFAIEITTLGVITGNTVLKGLPFTVTNETQNSTRGGTVTFNFIESLNTAVTNLAGGTEKNTKFAYLRYMAVAAVSQTYADAALAKDGTILRGVITYETDE